MHTRRNLTKLRISAHNLAIETGRYSKKSSSSCTDTEKRLCFNCKSIESEFHLIFECQLYEDVRKQFVELLNEYTTIPFQATINEFCTLMSCLNGDLDVARIFCDFINNCFDIRKDYCNKTKENNILIRPETSTTRYGRISKRPNRIDL